PTPSPRPSPAAPWARGLPGRAVRQNVATRCRAAEAPPPSPRPRASAPGAAATRERKARHPQDGRSRAGRLVAEGLRRSSGDLAGNEHLVVDERDRLVERCPARTDVTHRGVLVPDRHPTEEDQPFWR